LGTKPHQGFEDDEIIIGRGASDQEGGMAAMVYAGSIIKDLGLEKDYTLMMTGTVQEETATVWAGSISSRRVISVRSL
jgi:acetylornithine deacetylase/succinyl-diaminopimelate desuccinylase-like protein